MGAQKSVTEVDGNKEAVILDVYESGASDSWQWIATLTISSNGHRSVSLDQVPWEQSDDWEDTSFQLDPVSSGEELFEFLRSHWIDEHYEDLSEEQWEDVAKAVAPIDAGLAAEIRQAVRDEYDPEPEPVDLEKEAFDAFVRRATYDPPRQNMWAGIAEGARARSAISTYCQRHLEQHGELPRGTHRVTYSFGDPGDDADLPNPLLAGGMKISGRDTFDQDVTFPEH